MYAFFSYIANITYYLLFAAVANMLAPAGKYRKFVSVVTGFILVVIILTPFRRVGSDFDIANFFNAFATAQPQFQFDEENYANVHHNQLSAAFNDQLSLQLSHLLAQRGIFLHEAKFTHNENFSRITRIYATVSRTDDTRRVPFIRIEPVRINRTAPDDAPTDPLAEEVKNIIADFYGLSHQHITIRTQMR